MTISAETKNLRATKPAASDAPGTAGERWDGLILGASLATLDCADGYGEVRNAALGWRDGLITYVGPRDGLPGAPEALAREVITVLGQHAPKGMEPGEMIAALEAVPGVIGVHDLHVWTLTSGMDVATAHLVTAPGSSGVLSEAAEVLRTRFHIAHATLQVEDESATECEGATW